MNRFRQAQPCSSSSFWFRSRTPVLRPPWPQFNLYKTAGQRVLIQKDQVATGKKQLALHPGQSRVGQEGSSKWYHQNPPNTTRSRMISVSKPPCPGQKNHGCPHINRNVQAAHPKILLRWPPASCTFSGPGLRVENVWPQEWKNHPNSNFRPLHYWGFGVYWQFCAWYHPDPARLRRCFGVLENSTETWWIRYAHPRKEFLDCNLLVKVDQRQYCIDIYIYMCVLGGSTVAMSSLTGDPWSFYRPWRFNTWSFFRIIPGKKLHGSILEKLDAGRSYVETSLDASLQVLDLQDSKTVRNIQCKFCANM